MRPLYSTGTEIEQYAHDVADKYDVRRHMRFNTTVEGARWDEDAKIWRVALAGGEVITTRYLITATGFLSQPHTPDIPGITGFSGKVIHTTAWDDGYDLDNRRSGIIGTGATAVQLIPELAKTAAELTVYQRTPIWVVPKIDVRFSERAKRLFARVPLTQRAIRWLTDAIYEFIIYVGVHHRYLRRLNIAASDLAKMHRFATIRDKELRQKLTPDYDFGCKRPTFSNGYYRTFTKPHVHLETSGIERIERDGIVAADGTKTVIDTLILATGFDLWEANFPAIEIVGREGRNLGKWWRDTPVPGLPGRDDAVLPELPEPGQPLRVPRAELLQHDGIPDAAHGPAAAGGQSPRCHHVRGHRGSQHPLPGPDDRTARRFALDDRQLRDVAVVLLQPQRRGDAAAADDGAYRDQRGVAVSPERLSD